MGPQGGKRRKQQRRKLSDSEIESINTSTWRVAGDPDDLSMSPRAGLAIAKTISNLLIRRKQRRIARRQEQPQE